VIDLGIRREDKNEWERRTPLGPLHVEELVRERGLTVAVQPAPRRVYSDEEYRRAGALVQEDLSECRIILGVKEIPPELLQESKPHLFFSHVIKGQPENMRLLRAVLEKRCTLIDYEPIVDRFDRRLIFFGRHAGYAGMVDALWAFGQRMKHEGIRTPFAGVEPAHRYRSVDDAERFLAEEVGQELRENGIDRAIHPLVVGFTGGGNVSQGAQEILDRLPVVEIEPGDLERLSTSPAPSRRAIYKVVFRRQDRFQFNRHLPHLTILVNGIYWEPGHPKLVTRGDLRQLWRGQPPRLRVIADLSCDIEGSVEATVRATTPDQPIYVFDPESGETRDGVEGHGPVVLAVDNLPTEFPRDASDSFGDSLFPFLSGLVAADYDVSFEHLSLPAAVLTAVIAHGGELSPRYRFLEEHLGQSS
jgi:alpha-aminoadipic semialdehyde synthase